jgi:anti-anti-sigma factor
VDSAERDRFLAGLERALRSQEDPDRIMAMVARLVGEQLACDRCAYAEAEADQDHFTMTGSYARGLPELTGRMSMSDFGAETLRCMREGEPYVVSDAFDDPRIRPDQLPLYRSTGLTAVICVPLRKDGRFVAAMAVHHATPRAWTAAEVDLLTTVVARCWESLQRAHALAAVRESEQRYRLLVERASDGIWLADADGRYIEANPAACELLGYTREQLLKLNVRDLAHPDDGDRLAALIERMGAGDPVTEVWRLRRSDGGYVPVELSMRAAGHGRLQSVGRDITARLRAEAERERLLQRTRESNRRLRLLQDATAALSAATTSAAVVEVILRHTVELEPAGTAVVLRHGDRLDPVAEKGAVPALPASAGDDHPLAAAFRTGDLQWGAAVLVVPLVLSGCAIGAVGMWFDGDPPGMTDGERAATTAIAGQCAQALDRARLHEAEHEVADVLQRSLLPSRLPVLPRLAAAARYTPAARHARSGGDWYDLIPVDGTRVALVVGDVVGHGPAAAAVMGQLRSALAAQLLDGHSPAAALERLDRFAARVAGATGSTCACLTHDSATGELRWALAGHPPVLLVDGAGSRFLAGGAGTALGVPGRPPYVEAGTTVAPGASAVLYTDGLVERRGERIDTGLERLAAAAAGLADLGPDALVAALAAAVVDGAGPADDIALLVVRTLPGPLSERLPAEARSMRALRRTVAEWAAVAGLPDDVREDLELALGEAAANAAEHAYPRGGLHIDCDDEGTEVRFRLPARAATAAAPPPTRPAGEVAAPGEPAVLHEPAAGRLVLTGDVDLTARDAIGPRLLDAAAAAAGPLVVDLTGVRYLSSAGVALLAEAAGRAGSGLSLVVAGGSAPARVLELTGLTGALAVEVRSRTAAPDRGTP